MDIREVISEIKTGETYASEDYEPMTVKLIEGGTLVFRDVHGNPPNSILLERNWKKVRKALTFNELLEEIEDGDGITVEHQLLEKYESSIASYNFKFIELATLSTLFGRYLSTEEIKRVLKEGKFYIEEV